jgi:ATP-dependent RNA helicase DeaD
MEGLRDQLARAISEEDVSPLLLALEPLFERFDPAEVAAAAVALLRKKSPAAPAAAPRSTSHPDRRPPIAWAKLFLSVGEREGLRPGDLLGAIVGETGIAPEKVGKIEIRESFSLVEVDHSVAQQIIQAINGTTIKGRAVRADFDRGGRGAQQGGRPGGRGGRPAPRP